MLFAQLFLGFIYLSSVRAQRSELERFLPLIRGGRQFYRIFKGVTGSNEYYLTQNRIRGKLQEEVPLSEAFPCDINGPGKRSSTPPKSVHELRPGDIDIIMGMGDSITAGNLVGGLSVLDVVNEYRGMVFSIGGQGSWRKYLTLPNILKEFNPNIFGYSAKDGFSFEKRILFNAAEATAMSRDMPYQAKVLLKRLQSNANVNMTEHWKLLTLFIGGNDMCSGACYTKNQKNIIANHERDILKTLRFLRDNIPRLMVNVIPLPNVGKLILALNNKSSICTLTNLFECPCFIGRRLTKKTIEYRLKMNDEWERKDNEIGKLEEFNKKDFTVNVLPSFEDITVPQFKNGKTDYRYLADDCFHLSQRAHARCANALWNNMIEPYNNKSVGWPPEFKIFKCPTKEQPFLVTRENS